MKLSDVKKLHQKKYRTQFGFYLVEGEHLVLELLKVSHRDNKSSSNQSGSVKSVNNTTLYITADYQQWVKEHVLSSNAQIQVEIVSSQQMQQLSDTKSPQGIIARVPLSNIALLQPNTVANNPTSEKYIYLHEVQDPGNLGTILRTLAWFGDFTLLLSPNSVDPYNSKVVRSSMGAIFHVKMELNVPLESLGERFERFAFLDMDGEEITSDTFKDYQCYLFGNEARGVPVEALSQLDATAYTIVGSGKIDSLNLASAVNICAYELTR